jgi:DNA-binding YbaB/EbfC family protein
MGKGFGGMGGMPGNLQGLMKQAQKMQEDLKRAQANAENLSAEVSVAGGAVKAVANGRNQISALEISQALVDSKDAALIQDSVLAAVNGALSEVQQKMQQEMAKVTGGMNLPGMF